MAGYIGSKSSVTLVDGITEEGGTLTGDLSFGDNDKAKFGAGDDLQIYHDGSNSYITDAGTGNTVIETNGSQISLVGGGEYMVRAQKDGATRLYYDGSQKIATTSTGVDVTGTVTGSTGITTGVNYGNFTPVTSGTTGARINANANGMLRLASGGVDKMYVLDSGNVGIGGTPSKPLHLKTSSGWATMRLEGGTDSGGELEFYRGSTKAGAIFFDSSSNLNIRTGNDERMRIDSSGNVRLANTSMAIDNSGNTATGLSVASTGITHIATSGNNTSLLIQRVSDTGTDNAIFFLYGSTGVGSVTVNSSSTAYNTSSDYRLKENVVDLTGASARVNQLDVKRFNFIADETNTLVDGFLAHEVATVVPEAITGTKDAMRDEEYEVTPATGDIYTSATDEVDEVIHSADAEQPETLEDGQQWRETTAAVMGTRSVPDYQGIDQSKLVPLLTAALQEALTEIASLKTRVEALEA